MVFLTGLFPEQSTRCSAYPSTRKAHLKRNGGFKQTRLNMQRLQKQTHTNFRRTFSETGVISQTGVGVYCTSVYKKERPAR